MKTSEQVLVILAVVVIILVCGVGYLFTHPGVVNVMTSDGRGGTSNADSIALGSNLNVGGISVLGTNGGTNGDTGWNGGVGRAEQEATAYCGSTNTGAYLGYPTTYTASTTQFAVNPYFGSGTSTVTIVSISASTGATSTMFAVGTSTRLTGLTPSAITPVAGSTTLATSTSNYFVPGTPGMVQMSGGTNARSFQVAPTEYVTGIATSSGNQIAGYLPQVACTVKMIFTQ